MALSTDLLELVKALERAELNVVYLVDHLDDITKDDPPHATAEEQREAEDTMLKVRDIAKMVVDAKQEPTFTIPSATVEWVHSIIPDQCLDEHFTIEALARIVGVTERWKQLANLGFARPPATKTAGYVRQAVGCYLYGMYDASAVLCRAVLEFALREAFERKRPGVGQAADVNLDQLIAFSANAMIITRALEAKAQAIRKRGNGAIHAASCRPEEVLTQLLETRAILAHLYGEAIEQT